MITTTKRKRQRINRTISRSTMTSFYVKLSTLLLFAIIHSYHQASGIPIKSQSTQYRHRTAPKDKIAALQYPIKSSDNDDKTLTAVSYKEIVAPLSSSSLNLANGIRTYQLPIDQTTITTAAAKAVSYRYESIGTKPLDSLSKNALMLLQSSPCYPEDDGYFGATHVTPIMIQYGFEIKSLYDAELNDALITIENMIIRNVIRNIFPNICGNNRYDTNTNSWQKHRMQQQTTLSTPRGNITGTWGDNTIDEVNPTSTNVNGGYNMNDTSSLKTEKVIGLKIEKNFKMDIDNPCYLLSGISSDGSNYCNIYFGYIYIYGYNIEEKGEIISKTIESIKSTIHIDTLSRVSIYGIMDIVSIDETFSVIHNDGDFGYTQTVQGNQNETNMNNDPSLISSFSSLTVGEKFGLAIAGIVFITGVIVLLLYVNLDIQRRRDKMMLSQRISDSLRGHQQVQYDNDIDNHPMKEKYIELSNKPSSNREIWGPLSFLRSHTQEGRRIPTQRTVCTSRVGDASLYDEMMMSGRCAPTGNDSNRFSRFRSNRVASHDSSDGTVCTHPPIIFEFEPGFDPPLGRPDDDDNDDDGSSHSGDDGEDNDDSATYNSSIADLSNIDEQIIITNRRTHRSRDGRSYSIS